jgi:hypothetical protein
MFNLHFGWCVLIGVVLWLVIEGWLLDEYLGWSASFIGVDFFVMVAWVIFGEETESGKRIREQNAARARSESIPHVVREADGCKTYRVKIDGRFHYYTRCGDKTTHTAPRTQGKSTVYDTIETDNI